MKNFILLAVLLIFLMFFPLQFILSQKIHHDILNAEQIVHRYAQEARTTGRFTADMIDRMRVALAARLGLPESEIVITATMTPKYRLNEFDERELIEYDVRFPIKKISAYNFGLTESENSMIYVISDKVASEVLAP